jgi:anti-anti-sigma factor
MEVAVEIREDKPVLVYSGRLDEEAAARFSKELTQWVERMLNRNVTELMLDFSGVTLISSVVLRLLLSIARRVRARGGVVCIANPSTDVQDTFAVIHFREIFESYGGAVLVTRPIEFAAVRAPAAAAQLDLLFGETVLPCQDGDTLGAEGSLRADLFKDLPGVAAQPVRLQNGGSYWLAIVAQEPGSVVRVDNQVIAPGQQVVLKGDHLLQIGEVRVHLHVTLPEGASKEGGQIDEQVQDVFSRTAEWIGRMKE